MEQSIDEFNGFIADTEAICLFLMLLPTKGTCHLRLKSISSRFSLTILHHRLTMLGSSQCPLPMHASAWLSVMPNPQQNLHLESPEFQVALKWWLGMDTSQNSSCSFCPSHALDPMGHHALSCKGGGDSIIRHNSLRDTFWESCKQACIAGQIEAGSGLDVEGPVLAPQISWYIIGNLANQQLWTSSLSHR